MPHPSSPAAIALLGLVVASCAGVPTETTITTTNSVYTVRQAGLVAPPTGPRGTGDLPQRGETLIEGGWSQAYLTTTSQRREAGQPGQIYLGSMAHFRAARLLGDRIELGIGGEYLFNGSARAAVADVQEAEVDPGGLAGFRLSTRVLGLGTRQLGILLRGEVAITDVRYVRYVDTQTNTSIETRVRRTGETTWDYSEASTSDVERHESSAATGSGGISGLFELAPGLTLDTGVMMRVTPLVVGRRDLAYTCVDSSGLHEDSSCAGRTPGDVAPLTYSSVTTSFLVLSLRTGNVGIALQGWYHLTSEEELVRSATPAGVDLSVRIFL
jgi:hypothetical protein